ncbi:MAG: hypothetical protein JSV33_07535 [bacterium]|nr:MAG: hypothetical protein JSV33_07535 [bacterium]
MSGAELEERAVAVGEIEPPAVDLTEMPQYLDEYGTLCTPELFEPGEQGAVGELSEVVTSSPILRAPG